TTTESEDRKMDGFLTKQEVKLCQLGIQYGDMKQVCQQLGVSVSRGYKIAASVRKKWKRAVGTNNFLLNVQKSAKVRSTWFYKMLLVPREIGEPNEDVKGQVLR